MEIELWELKNIVEAAAKRAVEQFIIQQNPTADEINERQAYREFGRGRVMNLCALGLIKPTRRGVAKNSPKVYSRSELRALLDKADPLLVAVTR